MSYCQCVITFHVFLQGIILQAISLWEERNLILHIQRVTSLVKTWTLIFLEIGQCRYNQTFI